MLLIIPNGEKSEQSKTLAMRANSKGHEAKFEGRRWHYLTIKKLSVLLRGIT